MEFYHLGYAGTLALPIKTFWLMSGNIDRIQAQRDMRSLTVAICGQSGEAAQAHRQHLVIEAGTIVKVDAPAAAPIEDQRDEAGFAELKRMAQQHKI